MNFVRAAYPLTRMRRNRASSRIRNLVAESHLAPADLIWPLFITDGSSVDIPSLPGVRRLSLDDALLAAAHAEKLGIAGVALFPATDPKLKDAEGTEAWNHDNLVCRALRAIRAQSPDLLVMCDVALDPYTDHGQDGVFRPAQHHQTILDQFGSEALAQSIAPGGVANDASIDALVKQAMTLVESGCRVLAPSDMMDGRVGVLRRALDGADTRTALSLAMRQNMRRTSMRRFAMRSARRGLCAATKKPIKWTRATATRPCTKSPLISTRGRTLSWSNLPCPTWILSRR